MTVTEMASTAYRTQTEEDVKQCKRNVYPENMNVSVQTHPDIVFQTEHGVQTYCAVKKDATKAREDAWFPQILQGRLQQTLQDRDKGLPILQGRDKGLQTHQLPQ